MMKIFFLIVFFIKAIYGSLVVDRPLMQSFSPPSLERVYQDIKNSLRPNEKEWRDLRRNSDLFKEYALKLKKMTRKKRMNLLQFCNTFNWPNATLLQKVAIHFQFSKLQWNERKEIKRIISPMMKKMNGNDVNVLLEIFYASKEQRTIYTERIMDVFNAPAQFKKSAAQKKGIFNVPGRFKKSSAEKIKKTIKPFISSHTSNFERSYLFNIFSKLSVPERNELSKILLSLGMDKKMGGVAFMAEHITALKKNQIRTLLRLSSKVFKKLETIQNRDLFIKNMLSLDPTQWRMYAFYCEQSLSRVKDSEEISRTLKEAIPDSLRPIL
ncbi:MAG: hypothetical protein HEEMFOPI_00124 [Holosporales bacterium]